MHCARCKACKNTTTQGTGEEANHCAVGVRKEAMEVFEDGERGCNLHYRTIQGLLATGRTVAGKKK